MAQKKREPDKKTTQKSVSTPGCPIVGMGASAGGLEAFESFFTSMPRDSGMAFVLISHLDPTHISLLPELLQKKTAMKVCPIEDGMKIQPDTVYAIPPNKDVSIINGVLLLMDLPQPRGFNLPIDNFFRSLAQDQGANAIAIVLSGTGSDGSLGVKQIKGELGMVMVQDEASAKYAGMPRSAIATGLADYILPVDKMPEALIKYTRHAIIELKGKISSDEDNFQKALLKIYILLRTHTNHDFSLYKKNTIIRRIERRMHVHQIDKIQDYVTYLGKSKREIHVLFKDLLIGVTSFFRDPAAFDSLKDKFLPGLLCDKPEESGVRIWVAGCSTGEEAYSIAIVLHECMEKLGRHFVVQIFATDLDEDAIAIARSGLYPVSISADVDPERLNRFFTREDNHFRVKKSIREMLVFAPQNLTKDPPFTKLDLLSCRNLLIYLSQELQKNLFPVFHYSLKPGGILFLGSSESIGQDSGLFNLSDRKWKIFNRRPSLSTAHPVLNFPVSASLENPLETKTTETVRRVEEINSFLLVETILQQSDTPPCAVIDEKLNIVYIHGRTGRYLEPAPGKVCNNILEMARPGLKVPLAAAIRKAATLKQEVTHTQIDIKENSGFIKVTLTVKPVLEYGAIRGMLMVVFNDAVKAKGPAKTRIPRKNESITRLEQELQYTRENLQTTIEELETANEELKSTNEELQSTNEELQSTNEELETSKEELQSLNEESATVNAELQSRIDELSDANDDMKNLLNSTHIGTIFLDIDLNIRRFTDMVTRLVPLTAADIGRPVSHFTTELKAFEIVDHARQVLKDLITQECEVQSRDSKFFRTRITPYRTMHNVIDGVVVTFEDITEFKKFRLTTQRLSVVMDSADAILILDKDGNITFWNKGAQKLYGYTQAEALKMNICNMVPDDKIKDALAVMKTAFAGELVGSLETDRQTKAGKTIQIRLIAAALRDERNTINHIVMIERDDTKTAKNP
ncbi:MAG: PAS domain-containing protein [Proteobacteria bacterium]|nr:PAS domain-containing protein [Pseudomonadota bacterium]MBU1584529.1 PAS domain-containing protein [Pseudomonadota bacterium]MBU2451722.1 PAS domain-containing protein [Pseudomonadota bacterium]MBU2629467.1 PAS domain-containing protein [Pseudomonadota bacterium]